MTNTEESHLRETALKMARELHPDTYQQGNQVWGQQSNKTAPSVETILKTSQTIYKWLLEGETNYEAGKK